MQGVTREVVPSAVVEAAASKVVQRPADEVTEVGVEVRVALQQSSESFVLEPRDNLITDRSEP